MTARGSFKQRDVTRAIKAVEAAGINKPYRVEIDDNGRPSIIVEPPTSAGPEGTPENLKDLL